MKSNAVTNKYAKALFDVTCSNGKSGEVASQILEISKIMDKNNLSFFENPFNAISEKHMVLQNTFEGKVNSEVLNFLNLLVDKNRMGLISDISKQYSDLILSSAGITKGKIYSSENLDKSYIQQVQAAVSKTLNCKVELSFEKDENLLAGYKVQVGGWTLDDSAQTHLKILKDELMKRGL